MAKQILLAIDGNWYLHRAAHTLKTNRSDLGAALARHFTGMICKDALTVKATHLVVAFDGPKVFRFKIYPNYKSGRGEGPKVTNIENADVTKKTVNIMDDEEEIGMKELYSYLPDVFRYLTALGIAFYQPTKYEADDCLCTLARRYGGKKHDGKKVRFVGGTQDKDTYQVLENEDTVLYDSSWKDPKTKKTVGRYITREDAERIKGVSVEQMVDYQTIIGDSGDAVPGLPPMGTLKFGPKTVAKYLAKYKSLARWMKKGTEEEKLFLAQHQAQLVLNKKLVTLVDTVLPPFELDDMKPDRISDVKKEKLRPPTSFVNWMEWLHPKSKGLFSRLGK